MRRALSGAAVAAVAVMPPALADPSPAAGNLVGRVDTGGAKVRVAVHLHRDGDRLSGTLDSPDENKFGLPIANLVDAGGRLSFDVPQIGGSYSGQWDEAARHFTGRAHLAGKAFALDLTPGGYPAPHPGEWDDDFAIIRAAGFKTVRIRYYGVVSSAFASLGVDSCAWRYREGFHLREGDHWVPGLVETIAQTREP